MIRFRGSRQSLLLLNFLDLLSFFSVVLLLVSGSVGCADAWRVSQWVVSVMGRDAVWREKRHVITRNAVSDVVTFDAFPHTKLGFEEAKSHIITCHDVSDVTPDVRRSQHWQWVVLLCRILLRGVCLGGFFCYCVFLCIVFPFFVSL